MSNNRLSLVERNWFWVALAGIAILGFCSRLLFTDQIIRASDVITQFYWGAKEIKELSVLDFFASLPKVFVAGWEPLLDGGRTLEGGWNAIGLLLHRYFIMHLFPFPATIAWLAVLSLVWGCAGTFLYCRMIGLAPLGALLAGLVFSLCTANLSLINAGHIQKLEAVCWLPWVMFFLESGLRSRRFFHYAMTGLMLALQFFNMHWQISFYTCLGVAAYWLFNLVADFQQDRAAASRRLGKDIALGAVIVALFFSTIAMSFAPLLSWSKQSERAGGMSREDGMSWSMPPEEILTLAIPGLVGFSRQEAGDKPAPGQVFYWGRMHFSQTNDYLGLLPLFLIPLALAWRRDKYTWFFSLLFGATLLMALGKYTFVYRFMFDYLPGFSTFRVPKMILFLFAFAAAVLAGKGLDALLSSDADDRLRRRWLLGGMVFTLLLGVFFGYLSSAREAVYTLAAEVIGEPTRYQESGMPLVTERYANMVREAGIAFGFALAYVAIFFAGFKRWLPAKLFPVLLLVLFLGDLWRVNDNFMVLTDAPKDPKKAVKSDTVAFLEKNIGNLRMQPLNEQSANHYAEFGLPSISAYVTISEKRYREYLDNLSLMGAMPDIMNLKYLVMPLAEYQSQQRSLAGKYQPVFTSASGSVVLENKTVMPKAWLVPSAVVLTDSQQRIMALNSTNFDPRLVGIVESPPPLTLAPVGAPPVGTAKVELYEPNRIKVRVETPQNGLLVLGEKYYKWWDAKVDGKSLPVVPVNNVLRGVYLSAGNHEVSFVFDPLPFKIGKYLTLASLVFFAGLLLLEWLRGRTIRQAK